MFKTAIKFFQKHYNYRKTYNELSNLSTRQLKDIGIERSMITRIAFERVYGKDHQNV